MAATVSVDIGQGGKIAISVIDLIGDLWSDFRYFMAEAASSDQHEDPHARNRNLRAALVCLMAHTEGVISGIIEKIDRVARVDLVTDACFTKKVEGLRGHAAARGGRIPYLDLRCKALRDVLVHPGIKRTYRTSTTSKETVGDSDLYDLTVMSLEYDGASVDRWLQEICELYNYIRQEDTEAILRDVSAELEKHGLQVTQELQPKRI